MRAFFQIILKLLCRLLHKYDFKQGDIERSDRGDEVK